MDGLRLRARSLDFRWRGCSWRMASGVGCIATYPAGGARADTVGTDVSSRAAQVGGNAMAAGCFLIAGSIARWPTWRAWQS